MTPIDNELFTALCDQAEDAPRRRAHHLLHASHDEPVQRMLIALQPGTYFRPHRHTTPPKWELMMVLKGAVAWLGFDDEGRVTSRTEAGAHKQAKGLEYPPGTWHALVCLTPDTVLFECKPGPFAGGRAGLRALGATRGQPAGRRLRPLDAAGQTGGPLRRLTCAASRSRRQ